MKTGRYIVIAGPTSAVKNAQISELQRRLQAADLKVQVIANPIAPKLPADTIERLINDPSYPMKTSAEVTVYNAAQALSKARSTSDKDTIYLVTQSDLSILVEHYYGQGTIGDYERINQIIRLASQDDQPDLTIVLDAPANRLTATTAADIAHLERLRSGYLWEAKQRQLPVVFVANDDTSLSDKIWQLVAENLAQRGPSQPTAVKEVIASMNNAAAPHEPPITPPLQPSTVHDNVVTSATGNIYVLNVGTDANLIALNQLSDSSGDMRRDILPKLVKRQQSRAIPSPVNSIIVEKISMLSASYLKDYDTTCYSRPLRLLAFHSKDSQGRYPYIIPKNLDKKTKAYYKKTMDAIFDLYANIFTELSAHIADSAQAFQIAQSVLPVAAMNDVGLGLTTMQTDDFIADLNASPLREIQDLSKHVTSELRKLNTASPADKPATNNVSEKKFAKLADANLSNRYSTPSEQPVTLTNYWPRNELDLLPYMLYKQSGLALTAIRDEVANWSYQQKTNLLEAYFDDYQHNKLKVLGQVQYSWDILADFASFISLQQSGLHIITSRQALTPRNGYAVPEIIEELGLIDAFEECFDLSLAIHSQLHAAGFLAEAQYATLFGHNMRFSVLTTGADLMELIANHKNSSLLTSKMLEKIADEHPLLIGRVNQLV